MVMKYSHMFNYDFNFLVTRSAVLHLQSHLYRTTILTTGKDVERLKSRVDFQPDFALSARPSAHIISSAGRACVRNSASKQSACDQVNLRSLNPCARSLIHHHAGIGQPALSHSLARGRIVVCDRATRLHPWPPPTPTCLQLPLAHTTSWVNALTSFDLDFIPCCTVRSLARARGRANPVCRRRSIIYM